MNVVKWTQKKMQKSGKPKKPVDRQKLIDKVATKAGGIGNIARQRKRHDKALEEIMKD